MSSIGFVDAIGMSLSFFLPLKDKKRDFFFISSTKGIDGRIPQTLDLEIKSLSRRIFFPGNGKHFIDISTAAGL